MELPRHLELDGGVRWVGTFRFNDGGVAGVVPDYAELDLRFSWRPIPKLELSLVGQNLLHDHHLEYVGSGSSPREEIGRRVFTKAAVRW
jgi:iron complex outermembrane receptor protein